MAAPQKQLNSVLERGPQIERAGAEVIADNRFVSSSDEIDPNGRQDRAQTYLRRGVTLTGATQIGNAYVLDVGNTRFHVRDKYVSRLRDVTDPKCTDGEACFYLVHKGMPKTEEIVTALLQLTNSPALFDRWATQIGAVEADGPAVHPCAMIGSMKMQTTCTPSQRAAEYLKRVARLTGAKHVRDDSYWLRAGRRNFLVDYRFVRIISRHDKSTCFSVATDPDTPSAEVVASALLQLRSNPKLFKKWRKQPGCMFKANGKKFRNIYRLSKDEG